MMTPRPIAHLRALEARYPRAWAQARSFRESRGRDLPEWPSWCYLPMAGAYAIVSGGSDEPISPGRGIDIGAVAALSAWRETQGLYVYDETLLEALWSTPVDGDLPEQVLQHLPEWCVYIALQAPRSVAGATTHGWYAHLEHDANDGRRELRLLLDQTLDGGSPALVPIALHLVGDLAASVQAFVGEARRQLEIHQGMTSEQGEALRAHASGELEREIVAVEPLVSVLLYLCSSAGEILARGSGAPHPRLQAIASRRPKAPLTWDVGVRLGSALAAAQAQADREGGAAAGSHASPRGHVRRAHWHHYWMGPHDDSSRRRLELRWLPPVPVNLDLGGIVPTVHEVN